MGRLVGNLDGVAHRNPFGAVDRLHTYFDWSAAIPWVVASMVNRPSSPSSPLVVKVACRSIRVSIYFSFLIPLQCAGGLFLNVQPLLIFLFVSGLLWWEWTSSI